MAASNGNRELRELIKLDDELTGREMLPHAWPHEAPERPFTIEGAHLAMQRHAGCPADSCARKRAAQKILVEAKHMVPDYRSSRNLP
ncbi:hypothetical protein ACWESM_18420 [Nocardia sp. NPDC003999]